MVRDIDAVDLPEYGNEAIYEQGVRVETLTIVDAIIEHFRQVEDMDEKRWYKLPRGIAEELREDESIDADLFLNDLTSRLQKRITGMDIYYIDGPVSAAISLFHERGDDQFVIDYTYVPAWTIMDVGLNLYTPAEGPLSVRYKLPKPTLRDYSVQTLGSLAKRVSFEADGRIPSVGVNAVECKFLLDEPPSWVGTSGARGCSFYVAGIPPDASWGKEEYGSYPHTLHSGIGKRTVSTYLAENFSFHGNHLYIPDGDGGWKEMVPK